MAPPILISMPAPRSPFAHSLEPRSCQKLSSGLARPQLVASQNTGVSPRAFPPASGLSKLRLPRVLCETLQRLCCLEVLTSHFLASRIKHFPSPAQSQRQGESPISSFCPAKAPRIPVTRSFLLTLHFSSYPLPWVRGRDQSYTQLCSDLLHFCL